MRKFTRGNWDNGKEDSMKKVLATILILTFSFSFVTLSSAANIDQGSISDGTEPIATTDVDMGTMLSLDESKLFDKQAQLNTIYNELLAAFKSKNPVGLYPNEYGGAYIDGDVLCVLITEPRLNVAHTVKSAKKQFLSYVPNAGSNIVFRTVRFSYNELLKTREDVSAALTAAGIGLSFAGINDDKNLVEIGVIPSDYMAAQAVVESNELLCNAPVVIMSAERQQPMVTVRGGDALVKSSGTGISTIGFIGTYNGNNAILTCGHGNWDNNDLYWTGVSSSRRLGPRIAYQYANNEAGDWSIIQVTTSQTLTPTVRWTSSSYYTVKGVDNRVAQNTTVYNYGKNGGRGTHTVTNSNTDIYHSTTFVVKNMVQCSTTSGTVKNGDSGGPVYYTTTDGVIACGVLSGASSTTMAFSPLELVSGFSVATG